MYMKFITKYSRPEDSSGSARLHVHVSALSDLINCFNTCINPLRIMSAPSQINDLCAHTFIKWLVGVEEVY